MLRRSHARVHFGILLLWMLPRSLPSLVAAGDAPAGPHFDPPLTIDHGGAYSGRWSSDDASTPAMQIHTTDAVVIENSELRGRGPLIATTVDHANVTVRNTRGVALNPNVAGKAPGRFFSSESCDRITVEHCELENTSGIYLLGYGGDHSPDQTVTIRFNRVSNIDGRRSDGRGGFLDFNRRQPLTGGEWEKGFTEVQFLQLDKVRHVPGIDIGWNQIVNEPGRSRVEDNISIYLSSGTAASPIRIHDNLVRGAYTIHPSQSSGRDAAYRQDWSYSGGGILLGDGSAAATEDAAAYVEAFGNVVLSTTNYGVAIAAGHDLVFHDNRIVSCGQLSNGSLIAEQNVGAYIWDVHHNAQRTPPTFYTNIGRDNWIAWTKSNHRNDAWHPNASAWVNNHALPPPITSQSEEQQSALWLQSLKAAHLAVGPTSSAKN